jgi:hypothetical protein
MEGVGGLKSSREVVRGRIHAKIEAPNVLSNHDTGFKWSRCTWQNMSTISYQVPTVLQMMRCPIQSHAPLSHSFSPPSPTYPWARLLHHPNSITRQSASSQPSPPQFPSAYTMRTPHLAGREPQHATAGCEPAVLDHSNVSGEPGPSGVATCGMRRNLMLVWIPGTLACDVRQIKRMWGCE